MGRVVVDQGFATKEEVERCVKAHKKRNDKNKTLAHLLVERDVVTRKQMERLRLQIEAERSGQQIPGFKVLGKLGAGAMATVFKGKQLSLNRLVAIKILPRHFTKNPEFIARFYAEGRAAATLNHPNIVQAYDVGKAGEYHYFVMEYVDGSTVHDQIAKHKRFPEREALDIIIQVTEALEHAHKRDLLHRDVKPKNIMLTKEGVAKLADMGLARAISDKEAAEAEAGKAFGTPYYISPEQIRGATNITPAADIYSLGATLYHMVTGAVPFEGKNPKDVMRKHLQSTLVPPDHVNPKLSAGISQVIEKMMAKEHTDRYRNCTDLLTDLRAVRKGEPPIIAAPEVPTLELESIAQAELAAQAAIPEDKVKRDSSPLSHPLVQVVVALFIISVIVNLLQLAF